MSDQLESLELRIAHMLRAGVILSGILLAIGWVWQMLAAPPDFVALHAYETEPLFTTFGAAVTSANWGLVVCYVGLFVLISLPLLRVLTTAILLWKQHDRILASAAIAVFTVILVSAFLGLEL